MNDWWVVEYDNKNFDSHVFLERIQKEFEVLLVAAGMDSRGTEVLQQLSRHSDNKHRIFFNPKAASLPGVDSLLQRYHAKPCSKPTGEGLVGFASST